MRYAASKHKADFEVLVVPGRGGLEARASLLSPMIDRTPIFAQQSLESALMPTFEKPMPPPLTVSTIKPTPKAVGGPKSRSQPHTTGHISILYL